MAMNEHDPNDDPYPRDVPPDPRDDLDHQDALIDAGAYDTEEEGRLTGMAMKKGTPSGLGPCACVWINDNFRDTTVCPTHGVPSEVDPAVAAAHRDFEQRELLSEVASAAVLGYYPDDVDVRLKKRTWEALKAWR